MNSFPLGRFFSSWKQHSDLTDESFSELWGIGTNRAKATLLATTKNGTKSAIMPLSQRYISDRIYNLKHIRGRLATDTLYADMKYLHGNTFFQVY